MPTNPYERMSAEELHARIAKRNELVIQQAQNAVAQSLQRNADNLAALRKYRERSKQDEQKLAAKRAETAKFKTDLAAKTKSQVQAIESGAVEPGSSEWDSIVQGAISAAKGVRPAKAVVPVASTESSHSYKNPFMEETVKLAVKESIIHNFMENAKPEFARRGAEKQRPKSWDKGTKSGSEKRKMREQGKREAREMNEEAEQFDPVKAFDSHIKATRNLLNPDARGKMPSEFYTTLVGKGVPHEEAVERTKNMYGLHPPVQRTRPSSYRGDYVYLRDPNTGESRKIAGHDAYDARKDGFYESVQHRLRKILGEGKDVGPEDAMAHEIPEPHPDYEQMSPPRTPQEISHQINLEVHGHHGRVRSLSDSWKQGILTADEAMKQIHDAAVQTKNTLDALHKSFSASLPQTGPSSEIPF